MGQRVAPSRLRHRLVALLDRDRVRVPEWADTASREWREGYAMGLRIARQTIRKG